MECDILERLNQLEMDELSKSIRALTHNIELKKVTYAVSAILLDALYQGYTKAEEEDKNFFINFPDYLRMMLIRGIKEKKDSERKEKEAANESR